jgi:hypothetical protein
METEREVSLSETESSLSGQQGKTNLLRILRKKYYS